MERMGLPVLPFPASARPSLHSPSGVPLPTSPWSSGRGVRSIVVGGARERTALWCRARYAVFPYYFVTRQANIFKALVRYGPLST